jgi:hypothetical protein
MNFKSTLIYITKHGRSKKEGCSGVKVELQGEDLGFLLGTVAGAGLFNGILQLLSCLQ